MQGRSREQLPLKLFSGNPADSRRVVSRALG
jgi:hypothetical protein